jgi:DNA (cytosine-5)-methyltransferase 1
MLRIGTDCSGIEAPIQALRQLQIPHTHLFSSDIDPYVVKSIQANYDPTIIFGDITKRNVTLVPAIDLYVAGFPCQPFSNAGDRGGFKDKRGNVFWSCLEVIKTKQPKYFILENVKALLWHNKGKTWTTIWNSLMKLKEDGYNIKSKVLNTKDYGIPQNRERIFIVGKKYGDFCWPFETDMDDIRNYVDTTNTKRREWKRKNSLDQVRNDAVFIDVDFLHYTSYPMSHKISPCVLARPSSLWCVPYHRYATCKEMADLQGFRHLVQVVSNSQLKKQLGNSMSVNVITAILNELL